MHGIGCKKGMIKMGSKKDRTGERFITNEGYIVEIVEYNNGKNVLVEFQDEYKIRVHTQYEHCKNGKIKNPYHPSIYEVGYLGVGKYKCSINGKMTKEYREWKGMLRRCYDEEYHKKRPTYKNVIADEYFHNFQNYCKWREDNYYEIEGETMCLDKDILVKGNKEYAPDKCIFVPERINTLFIKCDNDRGSFPIGVSYNKQKNKYAAQCNIKGKTKHLGYFNTVEEAFLAYKEFKEAYIKQVADEYKDRIPQRLYDAMYAWEVEIND